MSFLHGRQLGMPCTRVDASGETPRAESRVTRGLKVIRAIAALQNLSPTQRSGDTPFWIDGPTTCGIAVCGVCFHVN